MQSKQAIIFTGPVGSGKSSTAKALAELLEHNDISCALIDVDALHWFHPTPVGDPFGSEVGFRHLTQMTDTWRELDIPLLILADVIEESAEDHQQCMPDYPVRVIRLDVAFDRLEARLRSRESESQVPWHLDRARELQQIMERNAIGDLVVSVSDESPEEIAQQVARELGFL